MKPSVTELIKLLDKPALLNWANKIGLQGIKLEEYRKKSLSDGISIHNQIEMYIKNKTPFLNIEHQNNFDRYFKNKEILLFEERVETEYFIGRMDIKISYKNKTYVCDFKSNQRDIYIENKLQLTAYRMASNCDGIGIISVPDFTYLPIEIKDFSPYENIIKALNIIYINKTKI